MKHLTQGFLVVVVLVFSVARWQFGIVPWSSFVPVFATMPSATQASPLTAQINKRQTDYDCGAYTIDWLLGALGQPAELRDVVALNRSKMIPNVGVVPEVLVQSLDAHGIDAQLRTFRWLSPQEKTQTLKATLEEKPVILLIKRHGYLHFVLLTGYNGNTVHIYDPMLARSNVGQTIDRNGKTAGNDAMSFNDLLRLWDQVSVMGTYKNMAVIVQP